MRCGKLWRWNLWSSLRLAMLAIVGSLILAGTVVAQTGMPGGGSVLPPSMRKKEDRGGGQYVTSYAIVGAGIILGLVLVCRPSNRRDRARPEQYEASGGTASK